MGVITITIGKAKPGRVQTHDKGSALATMYAGLYDRLHKAFIACVKDGKTQDDFNPEDHPHAPAGSGKGGQFTATPGGPSGPKPTSVKAKLTKAALHELLSTGHAFSKKELLDIMGPDHKEVTVNTWLSKFKSAKHAGEYGALDIKKLPNGSFQVVMPNGDPAPPAPDDFKLEPIAETPLNELLVKPPKLKEPQASKITVPAKPMSKADADNGYALGLSKELHKATVDIEDGMNPTKAVMKFKKAKAQAMAQWATNTTGQLHEPKQDDTIYEADKIFASELASAVDSGHPEGGGPALANWKKNTQLEKQGKLGAKPPPKPDTKPVAAALANWADGVKDEPAPQPKPYEHLIPKGFKHIDASDFTTDGTDNFCFQMLSLKQKLAARSVSGTAVGNKMNVEASLNERLKNSKHFQSLSKKYQETGTKKSLAARLIDTWAGSSGDHNPLSCALQVAAHDAFALPDAAIAYDQLESVKDHGKDDALMHVAASKLGIQTKTAAEAKVVRAAFQDFVHAQYDNTQAMFKEMGLEHVMVARGMRLNPGQEHFSDQPANVKLQPASSFSAEYSTASSFAGSGGTVYLCKIPVSQVLGSYLTGFGCTGEHELVVLGHDTIKSFPVKKASYATGSLTEAVASVKDRINEAKQGNPYPNMMKNSL